MWRFHHSPRRILAVFLSLAITSTAGALVLTQQTANAAGTNYQTNCAPYKDVVCFFFWPDADNTANAGQFGRFDLSTLMNRCRGLQQMDNKTGSAYMVLDRYVTRAYRVTMYANPGCTGKTITFGYPGPYQREYIGSYKFSSFKVTVFVR